MKPNEYEKLAELFRVNLDALKDKQFRPQSIDKPDTPLYAMAAAVVDYLRGEGATSKGNAKKRDIGSVFGEYIQDLLSLQMISRRLYNRLKCIGVESLTEIAAVDFTSNSVVLKDGRTVKADGLGRTSLTELVGILKKNGYGAKVVGK